MIALALLLAGQISENPTPAQRQRDEVDFCNVMRRMTREAQADLPLQVDSITRTDGFSVICSLRTVTWNKTVSLATSRMTADFREVKQQQFNHIICDNTAFGPMARRGWRFVTNISFADGERITLDAHC